MISYVKDGVGAGVGLDEECSRRTGGHCSTRCEGSLMYFLLLAAAFISAARRR